MRNATLMLCLLLGSCTGRIEPEEPDEGPPGDDRTTDDTPPGEAPPSYPVGPAPLRRFNRREYNNAVRDLLGDKSNPADKWTADGALSGFDTDAAGQDTTEIEVDQFRATAEILAKAATTLPMGLSPAAGTIAIAGCDPRGMNEGPCSGLFINNLGSRAYRRPLTVEEKSRLKAVFDFGLQGGSFLDGLRLVIETVLQSPHFLFRPELGRPGAKAGSDVLLTGPELATRLAFFLNGTMPDKQLMARAKLDYWRTPELVEEEARRLLAKPEARAVVATFHEQWLGLERLEAQVKDSKLYPGSGPNVIARLLAGTRAFVQHLYLERADAPLEELFTAPYVFADRISAPTYGMPATSSTILEKATPPEPRAGLLTDAAVMAALASSVETKPIARGVFVRTKLLCQSVSPPPNNMIIEVPPPDPKLTTRDRYAMHRSNPTCAGCHAQLDPIGFGFESYDAAGRYRATENGKPVDARGELTGTADSDGAFDGATELARRLVNSRELPGCLAQSWLTFALGRAGLAADEAAVSALTSGLQGPRGSLRELLAKIAGSPAFRFRRVVAVEACQ